MRHPVERVLVSLVVVALAVGGVAPGEPAAQTAKKMYWTNGPEIRRANLDGTGLQVLISVGSQPWGISLDVAQGHMYWGEYGTGWIRRANLDGTGVVNLLVGQPNVSGLALDLTSGKMYWTLANLEVAKIRRANLDGTAIEDIATAPSARDLELHVAGGKVYWTDWLLGTIQRANLDGTSPETIVTGLDKPYGIELDTVHGLLYWADSGTNRIRRANLDGTGKTDVLTGLNDPVALALDVAGGKLYWSFHLPPTGIRSANVDGTGTQDLLLGGDAAYDIALDLSVGSWAHGFQPRKAVCTNLTTGQRVKIKLLPGALFSDCAGSGLTVNIGDQLKMVVTGPPRNSTVGGLAHGFQPTKAVCRNVTTGQRVKITLPPGALYSDCTAGGLVVRPGDKLRMTITGSEP